MGYFYILMVSILVLMDLCIKTAVDPELASGGARFNPCFNGSMYKNKLEPTEEVKEWRFQSLF